jgi:hypothetical protein
MAATSPHYVKFARSLALTSTLVLGGCIASPETGEPSDEPAPPPAAPAPSDAAPRHKAGDARGVVTVVEPLRLAPAPAPQSDDHDAGPSPGHVSGPLPPPELPASFA